MGLERAVISGSGQRCQIRRKNVSWDTVVSHWRPKIWKKRLLILFHMPVYFLRHGEQPKWLIATGSSVIKLRLLAMLTVIRVYSSSL